MEPVIDTTAESPYAAPAYSASPYSATAPPPVPDPSSSPGLAFVLGLIPGVGAIYNGQYAKGLLHAVIWGMLMSIADSRAMHGAEPVVVITMISFWGYMVMEAYHTARKRRAGEPVDEYSSILNLRSGRDVPIIAIGLIVFGTILLLTTLDLLDFERIARYWPALLIAAGVYLLYGRVRGEAGHERQ